MTIKLGIGGQMYPPMRDAVEYCKRVEEQGWDFIQFADQMQSTHPGGLLPTAEDYKKNGGAWGAYGDCWFGSFEMMSAAAMVTENIEIHLSAIDPLRRSPAVFAQEAVTVSHLSEGRAVYHIAQGESKQFWPYGEKRDKPLTRMMEAIRVMDTLFDSKGEPVSRDSEFWPLKNAVFPIPLFDASKPPFYIVGGGPKVEQFTAEIGSGWSTFIPGGVEDEPEQLAEIINRIKQKAIGAGRDPEELQFFAMVFIILGETDEAAWQLARMPAPGWMAIAAASITSAETWKKWGFEHPLGDFVWPKDASVTTVPFDQAREISAHVPDTVLDRSFCLGNPKRVAARIKPYIEAGLTHISFWNYGACADPASEKKFLPLMSEVVNELRGTPLKI